MKKKNSNKRKEKKREKYYARLHSAKNEFVEALYERGFELELERDLFPFKFRDGIHDIISYKGECHGWRFSVADTSSAHIWRINDRDVDLHISLGERSWGLPLEEAAKVASRLVSGWLKDHMDFEECPLRYKNASPADYREALKNLK